VTAEDCRKKGQICKVKSKQGSITKSSDKKTLRQSASYIKTFFGKKEKFLATTPI
jgi:hypothetical protein